MFARASLVVGLSIVVVESGPTMNSKPYTIANPLTPASAVREFRGEYFEMYGSWQTTRYADVDWHPDPVPLPSDIVQRFDNKVCAFEGGLCDAGKSSDHIIKRPKKIPGFQSYY